MRQFHFFCKARKICSYFICLLVNYRKQSVQDHSFLNKHLISAALCGKHQNVQLAVKYSAFLSCICKLRFSAFKGPVMLARNARTKKLASDFETHRCWQSTHSEESKVFLFEGQSLLSHLTFECSGMSLYSVLQE